MKTPADPQPPNKGYKEYTSFQIDSAHFFSSRYSDSLKELPSMHTSASFPYSVKWINGTIFLLFARSGTSPENLKPVISHRGFILLFFTLSSDSSNKKDAQVLSFHTESAGIKFLNIK